MKKTLLLLAVVVFATLATKAQVSFGVKAGANLSNFRGSDVDGTKSQIGFHFGGLAEINLFDKAALQPELLFSREGAKGEDEGVTSHLNLSYINVPVLFKYNVAGGFYLASGPQLGFLVSAKTKAEGESMNVKDGFKSTNFSWVGGVGYKTQSGLGFDLRYNLGLSKLPKEGDFKAYGTAVQLGVFYIIK